MTADREGEAKDIPGNIASETSVASLAPSKDKLPFEPASLPAVESIGAGPDIRAFLDAGVPDDLTRAAFRRVRSSDLTIRPSENSWDFNAARAFGAIAGEDVGRLFDAALWRA